MNSPSPLVLSVIVPVFNERQNIAHFHSSLKGTLTTLKVTYEIIYCNDGSTDGTLDALRGIAKKDTTVRIVTLSRNFGKEVAMTAGLHAAAGQAMVMIDGDGQHPVELIPQFLERWRAGAKVVVGVRTSNNREGWIKRWGSRLFYLLINKMTGLKVVAGSTDFRLIDQTVQRGFLKMTERNRITRGLVDWLGYKQDLIYFTANPRVAGEAQYSVRKLVRLAVDSFISLSVSPLYVMAYIGAAVLFVSTLLGVVMFFNAILHDPLTLHASGSGYAMVVVLFLVGILLVSQGIIGLYLSHIHSETQNRPLYVIDEEHSVRLHDA